MRTIGHNAGQYKKNQKSNGKQRQATASNGKQREDMWLAAHTNSTSDSTHTYGTAAAIVMLIFGFLLIAAIFATPWMAGDGYYYGYYNRPRATYAYVRTPVAPNPKSDPANTDRMQPTQPTPNLSNLSNLSN